MVSAIDPTKPQDGVPASKLDLRNNLRITKEEIEQLQGVAEETLSIYDFGTLVSPVVDDGTTDNADAFRALGDYLRTNESIKHTIKFHRRTAGVFSSSHQRFLMGVPAFALDGGGCTLTAPVAADIDLTKRTVTYRYYDLSDIENFSSSTPHTGLLFQSANVNDTTITLQPSQLASIPDNLHVGRCVIFSESRQGGGLPPNPKLWEWNEVLNIDSGTGVVTLLNPLVFSHRDEVIDDLRNGSPISGSGAPRILSLDGADTSGRRKYHPTDILIKDIVFQPQGARGVETAFGEKVVYQNVSMDFSLSTIAFNPTSGSFGRLWRAENVKVLPNQNGLRLGFEGDKFIDRVEISACSVGKITQNTGVRELIVDNGETHGSIDANASALNRITGGFISSSTPKDGFFLNRSRNYTPGRLDVQGVAIHNSNPLQDTVAPAITVATGVNSFVTTQIGASGELIWDYGATDKTPSQRMSPGAAIYKDDGSNFGVVDTVFDFDSANALGAVRANLTAPGTVADEWFWHTALGDAALGVKYHFQGREAPHIQLTNAPYLSAPGSISTHTAGIDGVKLFRGATDGVPSNIRGVLAGSIEYVKINIIKGYTGPNPGSSAHQFHGIAARNSGASSTLFTVDLTTTGVREFDAATPGNSVLLGSDTVDTAQLGLFWPYFHIVARSGPFSWPLQGAETLPIVTIEIRTRGMLA